MLQDPENTWDKPRDVYARSPEEAQAQGEKLAASRSNETMIVTCLGCKKMTLGSSGRAVRYFVYPSSRGKELAMQSVSNGKASAMKGDFNPLKTETGAFRVALNLTALGDKAWEILSLSQQLGFPPPQFKTTVDGTGFLETWAVLLQQMHRYDADSRLVVDIWDDQLHELWQAYEPDAYLKLQIATNLEECQLAA